MRALLALILTVVIAGCASLEKDFTTFEPLRAEADGQVYRFTAMAGVNAAHDSSSAEETRMEALGMWLKDNGLDGRPYKIESRQLVVKSSSGFGTVHQIFYEVKVPKKSP